MSSRLLSEHKPVPCILIFDPYRHNVVHVSPSNITLSQICREGCGECKCTVLFSDDAQKFLMLKQLNEKQQELASRQQALVEQMQQAKESASAAAETYQRACKAVEKRQKEVASASAGRIAIQAR